MTLRTEMSSHPGHQKTWPTVTVIVPVHGDRGGLRATADCLAAQDYPGDVRVVIIDNGDNENLTTTSASLKSVEIITESMPGSYAARNAGLQISASEVVAFTDGDCQPRPDWLRRAVTKLIEDEDDRFVGGKISLFSRDPRRPSLAEIWESVNGLRQEHYVQQLGWAATANMVTRRRTLDRVGFFDSSLKSGGDRDWGERAVAGGVEAVYAEDAVVDHPARPTMRDVHTKVRRTQRGAADLRRVRSQPAFDAGEFIRALRPHTRSILRRSASLGRWSAMRVKYVVVSHWMQYYALGSRLVYSRGLSFHGSGR